MTVKVVTQNTKAGEAMSLARLWKKSVVACLMGALVSGVSGAYPEKAVRIVVPFPPGGATDVVARALGARLGQIWQQPVVIENKAGAGGNIGADTVVKSAPDGYTLLMSSPAEIAINPHLYSKMPFDPMRDLVPVTRVASAPLVMVVNAGKSTAKSVADVVSAAKSDSRGLTFASSGTGGPQHLAGELFKLMSGAKLTHIPYKGGAPAITDLLGGQVDFFFAGIPPAIPHLKSGKLRALAVTTAKPSALLPGVPALAESGFMGFDIVNWQGIFVPAGTSMSVVEKLAKDIAAVAADKAFVEQLAAQGAVPTVNGPREFRTFVQQESAKYQKLVSESGARVD